MPFSASVRMIFLDGIADRLAKNFGGLQGSQPGAGQHGVRLDVQCAQAERGGMRSFHSLGSERALGVRRAIGIFTVHGDAVADQDKDASLRDPLLFNHQDTLKRQAQIQLPFEQARFSFDAGEVQPGSCRASPHGSERRAARPRRSVWQWPAGDRFPGVRRGAAFQPGAALSFFAPG